MIKSLADYKDDDNIQFVCHLIMNFPERGSHCIICKQIIVVTWVVFPVQIMSLIKIAKRDQKSLKKMPFYGRLEVIYIVT